MAKIQAVMFDLDGTLADSFQDITDCVNYVLEHYGKRPKSLAEIRKNVGHGLRATLERSMGNASGGDIDEAVKMFRDYYWEHCLDNTVLYPGVKNCLDRLGGYPKGVVTNKRKAFAEKIVIGLGIRGYFEEVFGGDEFPAMKPNARALLYACGRLGVDASQVIMVGDGLPDIGAAVAAGAIPVAVTYGIGAIGELKARGAKYFLDSLEKLPALVENFPQVL